jgi:ABC-type transport system substrate-binding protein
LPGYTEEGITTYEYNPELAMQMLEEAGYANSLEFTAVAQTTFAMSAFHPAAVKL